MRLRGGKIPDMQHGHLLGLRCGDACPNCSLGHGLRASSAIEVGLTGWEGYQFLHCGICGINYVGRDGVWDALKVQALEIDDVEPTADELDRSEGDH